MDSYSEVSFSEIAEDEESEKLIEKVIKKCMEIEDLEDLNVYVGVTLTNPEKIRQINAEKRKIDMATDVLSFPMFLPEEIQRFRMRKPPCEEALGDIIISIEQVEKQAKEYGHSFERELAYMVVHGFYHLLGEDHMTQEQKERMREKEEKVLAILDITRD